MMWMSKVISSEDENEQSFGGKQQRADAGASFLHGFVFLLHCFVAIRCMFFAYVYFFGGVWLHGLFESSLALRSHVIVTACLLFYCFGAWLDGWFAFL